MWEMDAFFWFVCLLICCCQSVVCTSRKNVLFLVSDDMRPEIGAYKGGDFPTPVHPPMITPNLDKLAAKSLLLKRAYVQQAVCAPSRTSLLTGRRPDTTHVYDLYTYWREVGGNFTTIPQYLKENGYRTIGMGKIFHEGVASDNNDPISWSEPYLYPKGMGGSPNHVTWNAIDDSKLVNNPLIDQAIAKTAVKTLDRLANSTQPFFMAVGFHRPHLPFVAPQSFFDMYPMESIRLPDNPYAPVNLPDIAWSNYDELRLYKDILLKYGLGEINTTLPDQKVLELRRAYYSAITYVDSLVGDVINKLEEVGLADNTIISFWGDHGWQLGEHGEWSKHTNFELCTHAPMMIHVPGLTDKGIATEVLTEFVDLFPTLAEASGLPKVPLCPEDSSQVRTCTEGVSLMPLITNKDWSELTWKPAVFSQFPRMDAISNTIMGYSIRTDTYRYTEWVTFRGFPHYTPIWGMIYDAIAGNGVELYDHSIDPQENVNRAHNDEYKSIRAQLSKQLRAGWRKALPSTSSFG